MYAYYMIYFLTKTAEAEVLELLINGNYSQYILLALWID